MLHTRPQALRGSREQLQFGAEIFGHAGLEADLEAQSLAIDALQGAGVDRLVIDLADARVLRGVLAGVPLESARLQDVVQALTEKDAPALASLTEGVPEVARTSLKDLMGLYGGLDVLDRAAELLPQRPLVRKALDDLRWLATHLQAVYPSLQVAFDLSDMSGYTYYSGPRFGLYGAGWSDALARGGRYDEVGAIFGRNRPAAGFSLDLKALAEVAGDVPQPCGILAPWREDSSLRAAVGQLRDAGEVVVFELPGHGSQAEAVDCDRELVSVAGRWVVQARALAPQRP